MTCDYFLRSFILTSEKEGEIPSTAHLLNGAGKRDRNKGQHLRGVTQAKLSFVVLSANQQRTGTYNGDQHSITHSLHWGEM